MKKISDFLGSKNNNNEEERKRSIIDSYLAKLLTEPVTLSGENINPNEKDLFEEALKIAFITWILDEKVSWGKFSEKYDRFAKYLSHEKLEDAFAEALAVLIKRGDIKNYNYYLTFLTPSLQLGVFNKIKDNYQEQLKNGIINLILQNKDFAEFQFFALVTDKTLQDALKEAIKKSCLEKIIITKNYFGFLEEETIEEIKKELSLEIEEFLIFLLGKGYAIPPFYFNFINNLDKLEKEPTLQKKILVSNIKSFFKKDAPISDKEIESEIDKIKGEEIKEIAFGRTILPIGIKVHTNKNSILDKFLEGTVFRAHKKDVTYVAGVAPNVEVVKLALNILNSKIKKYNEGLLDKEGRESLQPKLLKSTEIYNEEKLEDLYKDSYFQVCVPERLPNEACGIATIAFLFLKKNIPQYDEHIIETNANAIGITIYDGGVVYNEPFFVAQKDNKADIPTFNGRTDMLFCKNNEEIEKAHFLLSLLVNAYYTNEDLLFKEIGHNFVEDFKKLLAKHNKLHWLNRQFVEITEEKKKPLADLLIEITNLRNEINDEIINYNKGVQYYEEEKDPLVKEKVLSDIKELKAKIDSSILTEIRSLVERYYNLVYKNKKHLNLLDYLKV
jgi:hypothetical protein